MSRVTKAEIRELGQLARLSLDDAEIVELQRDLSSILDHMDVLSTVDTSGIPPMTHASEASQLRPDSAMPSLAPEVVLSSSSHTDGGCFSVPAILPHGTST